jgi:SH3 domain protein
MPGVEVRLQASEDKRKELANELATLSKQHDQLKRQFDIVEASGQGLQKELAEVRRLSANAIKVDSQNKSLRVSLAEMQAQADKLQADNERLASRTNREWFVIGALVIIVGMLIGLTVPRIRWRKKSSWGDL